MAWAKSTRASRVSIFHDDVIKWKHFPRYWPFVWGIHRSPANSPRKGQWRGALMFSLICVWINGWVNNGELRRYRAHYDVTVMSGCTASVLSSYRFTQWLATHSTQIRILNINLLQIGHVTPSCDSEKRYMLFNISWIQKFKQKLRKVLWLLWSNYVDNSDDNRGKCVIIIDIQQLQFFHKLIRHLFLLPLSWRLEEGDDDTLDDSTDIDDEVGGGGSDGDDTVSESVSELTTTC